MRRGPAVRFRRPGSGPLTVCLFSTLNQHFLPAFSPQDQSSRGWGMANGRLFGATRCLGVSARLSPHMLRRPLEVQDRAWARKKRGTRVLGLYFWSQAVIARGGPKHSPHLGDVNTYSVSDECTTRERIPGCERFSWDALDWKCIKPTPQSPEPQDSPG